MDIVVNAWEYEFDYVEGNYFLFISLGRAMNNSRYYVKKINIIQLSKKITKKNHYKQIFVGAKINYCV